MCFDKCKSCSSRQHYGSHFLTNTSTVKIKNVKLGYRHLAAMDWTQKKPHHSVCQTFKLGHMQHMFSILTSHYTTKPSNIQTLLLSRYACLDWNISDFCQAIILSSMLSPLVLSPEKGGYINIFLQKGPWNCPCYLPYPCSLSIKRSCFCIQVSVYE